MRLLKTTLAGFFLFSSVFVYASGPENPSATTVSSDNAILKNTDIFQSSGDDLSQYGLNEPLYKRLQWGIKVGFNFTGNGKDPHLFTNPEFGPVIGPCVALPLNQYLGVRMEILYSQDVFENETSIEAIPTSYINRLGYIDIPLIAQLKPIEDLSILVGGSLSFLVSNTYTYAELPNSTVLLHTNTKNTVLSYLFGIEYTIYDVTGGFRLSCDVPDNYNLPSPKTIIGQFTVGYTFQFYRD